eukprot:366391-Chlamydomonas_euryale.AAC.43
MGTHARTHADLEHAARRHFPPQLVGSQQLMQRAARGCLVCVARRHGQTVVEITHPDGGGVVLDPAALAPVALAECGRCRCSARTQVWACGVRVWDDERPQKDNKWGRCAAYGVHPPLLPDVHVL